MNPKCVMNTETRKFNKKLYTLKRKKIFVRRSIAIGNEL